MASPTCNPSAASNSTLVALPHIASALSSFVVVRAIDELCAQMLGVAIAWYVYNTTHNPLSLAYVGLARFLPNILVMPFAGQAADRFNRPRIIALSIGLETITVVIFCGLLATASLSVRMVYLCLVLFGAGQAFSSPAMAAMLPRLVNNEEFPRAVAVVSSAFQICALAGPALGGLLYSFSAPGMFAVCAILYGLALTQLPLLAQNHPARSEGTTENNRSALGGIRYIWSNRVLLGIVSLDLFAVLLGGVTALLPIYAKDILKVGPVGLGFLRCAPGVGAAIVGLILTHHTICHGAGKLMLRCVAGFGFSTIVFALSTNLWLSLVALMWAGGFDMVSMVIRQTLIQVSTPDAMRGRVSSVQFLFIGASSELGEFESGTTAALFGSVSAALLGGLGTLAVVGLWSKLFPELRHANRLQRDSPIGRSV